MKLAQLAQVTGAELVGDPDLEIAGVADLKSATKEEVSFFTSTQFGRSFDKALAETDAGAIFIAPDADRPEGKNLLLIGNPSQAFQKVAELLHPQPASAFTGIHPSAVIHPSAQIGEKVTIGPNSVIDQDVVVGPNTTIGAQVFIGAATTIGSECTLHPQVVIREACQLGKRVEIQSGAIIGSCGFGYTSETGKHHKLKQLGNVVLEDDVEIGANTTVDRGRFKSTIVHRGTKIDNLVQIAHNVEVGEDNLIVGQTGIAGSTKTGKHVVLAGQVAVNGHIELCDQTVVGARSGVMQSTKEAGTYIGEPAIPYNKYRRHFMHLMRLERYAERIKKLEEELKALSKDQD